MIQGFFSLVYPFFFRLDGSSVYTCSMLTVSSLFFLLIFPLRVSFLVSSSFPSWFDRVGIWEAAKWVAKVRDITCTSCSKSVILKTNMQSGHFGEGGRFMHCDETAFDYAFLMKALRLDDITIA